MVTSEEKQAINRHPVPSAFKDLVLSFDVGLHKDSEIVEMRGNDIIPCLFITRCFQNGQLVNVNLYVVQCYLDT